MVLEDVLWVYLANFCGGDKLQEESLYGMLVAGVAFDLDSWCCQLFVVPDALNICPNAL